jgi:hypothetical protein
MKNHPDVGCVGDNTTISEPALCRRPSRLIDGLPGSGKSMAAEAVGRHLSHSRISLETAPHHPLLVATPDRMGAAFRRHSRDTPMGFVCRCSAREVGILPEDSRM